MDIVALRSVVEDEGAGLKQLLAALRVSGSRTVRFAKVHPSEFSRETLGALGFRSANTHRLYAVTPGSE